MKQRSNPYHLIFNEELEAKLDAVRDEAAERGVDVNERERFSMLIAVGELLGELVPEGASPDVIREVAGLLFHCYHFRNAGQQTFEIEEPVLRELLSTGFIAGPWEMAAPAPAGYVVLPRNRIWSRITEDTHPEAIDGFFFTRTDILFVLGLMEGRPGFSIMEVGARHLPDEHTSVAELKARTDGEDFANILPGGELQGHFAVTNNIEALKLAARCFWQLTPRG
jgi:hypothetical protein